MPLYQMPDGNNYEFQDDAEATLAMEQWQKQFGAKEEPSKLDSLWEATKGTGAALADLAVGIPETLVGTLGSAVATPFMEGGAEEAKQKVFGTIEDIKGPSIGEAYGLTQTPAYEAVMAPFEAIGRGFEWLGEQTSPETQLAAEAGTMFLPIPGGKMVKRGLEKITPSRDVATMREELGYSRPEEVLSPEELAALGEKPAEVVREAQPRTAVDETIAAKEQPAMGPVERTMPTEETGLSPARTEDVLAAQARENQARINAEQGGGVFIKDPERIQQYRDTFAEGVGSVLQPRRTPVGPEVSPVRETPLESPQKALEVPSLVEAVVRSPDPVKALEEVGVKTREDAIMAAQVVREEVRAPSTNTPATKEQLNNLADDLEAFAESLPEKSAVQQELSGFVPKGERGSWTPFASSKETKPVKPAQTYESFLERATKAGYSKEQIDSAWSKIASEKTTQNVSKVINKIPGLRGMEPVEQKSFEEMLPQFKAEPDIKKTPATDLLRSGGRMKALQTESSLVNWAVEKIYATKREHEVIQKRAEQEVLAEMHGVRKTLGDKGLVGAVGELLKVEGEAGIANLDPRAKRFADTLRKNLDELHTAVEEVSGKRRRYRPNYLAGVFTGPYRSIVKNTEGNVIGVIAGKTMDDARAGVQYFRQQFPEFAIEEPAFSETYKKRSYQKEFDELAIHNNELLDVFGETPEGQKFLDAADDYYKKRMYKHLEYYQHFKSKKGVIGSEGSAPWRNALDNANDLINAQLKILEDGWEWVAAQKSAKEIRQILKDENLFNKPNAKDWIISYFARAYNKGSEKKFDLSGVTDWTAQRLGVSPQVFSEASGLLRNFTMSQVLGWNPAFWVTQIAQVPQALVTTIAFLKESGVSASSGTWSEMFTIGFHDAAKSLTSRHEGLSKPGKYFDQYARKMGVYDPHLVEHSRVGKLIPTTGMSGFKRTFVDNLLNHPYKAADWYAKKSSQLSIELLESKTRSVYYMSVAHYLHHAGYPLKEAASMADKLTSTMFVDYHPTERPALWNALGDLGKYASAVSTFKFNYLNQLATMMSKKDYKTLAAMGLVLWTVTGMQGMPGMDEIDSVVTKASGLVSDKPISPKALMMTNTPDLLYYGALSEASGMSLQTKFSQANIFAGDALEFLYPLASYWTSGFGKTATAIKQRTPEAVGAALQAGVPGYFKSLPEAALLTKDTGQGKMTINPNKLPRELQMYARNNFDWLARSFGTFSNEEYRAKEVARMVATQTKLVDDKLRSKLDSILYDFLAGNSEDMSSGIQKYLSLGGTPESVKSALKQAATNANVDINIQTQMKYGKSKSPVKQEIYQEAYSE